MKWHLKVNNHGEYLIVSKEGVEIAQAFTDKYAFLIRDALNAPESASVLRQCPFCGGEAESDTTQGFYKSDGSLSNAVAIYCTKCDVQMSKCWSDYPELDPDNILKILRHVWNCRA